MNGTMKVLVEEHFTCGLENLDSLDSPPPFFLHISYMIFLMKPLSGFIFLSLVELLQL